MTDRELLEWAAKAAGIIGHLERDTAFVQERYYFNVPYDNQGMLAGFEWNPLTDDGDALRLAVKLRMDIDVGSRDIVVMWAVDGEVYSVTERGEKSGGDPAIATRRAIVRAAAEIGKGL